MSRPRGGPGARTGGEPVRARRRLARECAAVLADAFTDDPWARHVVGGEPRPAALARTMRLPLLLCARHGDVVTVALGTAAVPPVAPAPASAPAPARGPAPAIGAVAAWLPDRDRHVTAAAVVRSGAFLLPLLVGRRTVARLEVEGREIDRVLDRSARPDDAYLWLLGVRRAFHGRGLARVAVERTAAAAAAAGHDRLLLATDNPGNVAVYQALGFELLETARRASGLTAHVLARRLAAGPGA